MSRTRRLQAHARDLHEHLHSHHPAHPLPGEAYSARKRPGFVMLDIGAGVGALIVHADPGMHGVEVEISPTGDDQCRSHKEVLERAIDGRPAFTAVFDQLAAGTYTLWARGEPLAREIAVTGGAIAQLHWRAAAA